MLPQLAALEPLCTADNYSTLSSTSHVPLSPQWDLSLRNWVATWI